MKQYSPISIGSADCLLAARSMLWLSSCDRNPPTVAKAPIYPRRAIDQMSAADAGVGFDDQLRVPVGLMREVPAVATGKSGNPVQSPNDGVGAEMEEIDVLAQGEMPDARMLFHNETARENPGETNVTGRMNGITE